MIGKVLVFLISISLTIGFAQSSSPATPDAGQAVLIFPQGPDPDKRVLRLDNLFFETKQGRTYLPAGLASDLRTVHVDGVTSQAKMSDGRTVNLSIKKEGRNFVVGLSAKPDADIVKWG